MKMSAENGMNSVVRSRKVSLWLGLLAVVAFLPAATAPRPARAEQPVPSLDVVPADAAFYSVMLRNREQYDAVVHSKAFAKIRDLPYVQMGLGTLQVMAADPDSPLGVFDAARRDTKLLAFLADILSDEVFVYGGPDFNQAAELVQSVNRDMQVGSIMTAMKGNARGSNADEIQGQALVRGLVNHVDLIRIPELVIGFKVKNRALAKEQLARLEVEPANGPRRPAQVGEMPEANDR